MNRLRGIANHAPALGVTVITAFRARVLCVVFLLSLALVPVVDLAGGGAKVFGETAASAPKQIASAWTSGSDPWDRIKRANAALLDIRDAVEGHVEQVTPFVATVRPMVLEVLLFFGAGNENVYPGREDWLFYRPDIEALTARGMARSPRAPEDVIAEFAADLAVRGIRLIVVPIPPKPAIHPEMFAPGDFLQPVRNPHECAFPQVLERAVRRVYEKRDVRGEFPVLLDPAPVLWEGKAAGPQYLRSDTHWTPDAMEAVADLIATTVRSHGDRGGAKQWEAKPQKIHGLGDTAAMLDLGESSRWNRSQEVETQRIDGVGGAPSDILLLGDSFTNIYSHPALGWGESAGLREHLSLALGEPVEALVRNDGGASATRRMLAAEPSRLDGKSVVIWQFAAREFYSGEWESLPIEPSAIQPSQPPGFVRMEPGESLVTTARIMERGPLPDPDSPYADFLTAFHIALPDGTEALVFLQTLKSREPTPASRLVPGDTVSLRLENWEESGMTSLNRGELDDIALQLEPPNFGTLAAPGGNLAAPD